MRKPRGGQILANRVIGPREVLGGGDRRVPAKGRGRTEPHRGRSGASWIWSTPLHTGASEGEFRSGYALTPSPSHSKNISLFTEMRTSERTVSEDGYSSFLFNPLWGFPVVAAGILFVVDQSGGLPAAWPRVTVPHPCLPAKTSAGAGSHVGCLQRARRGSIPYSALPPFLGRSNRCATVPGSNLPGPGLPPGRNQSRERQTRVTPSESRTVQHYPAP